MKDKIKEELIEITYQIFDKDSEDADIANEIQDYVRRSLVGKKISATDSVEKRLWIDTQVIVKETWGLRKFSREQVKNIRPALWNIIKLSIPLTLLLTLLNDSRLSFSLVYIGMLLATVFLWAIRQKNLLFYCTPKIDTLFIAVAIIATGLYILAMFHGPYFQFFSNLASSLVLGACLALSDHFIEVLMSFPTAIKDKAR